jgi:hypothetical protein
MIAATPDAVRALRRKGPDMVRVAYPGLGTPLAAVSDFEGFKPYVTALRTMQQDCRPDGGDFLALDIPVHGLETAAFHFTRRPYFYDALRLPIDRYRTDHIGLGPNAAVAAFRDLEPYWRRVRDLQLKCRPFGRDYQALGIISETMTTAAYHFTGDPHFFRTGPLLGHSS